MMGPMTQTHPLTDSLHWPVLMRADRVLQVIKRNENSLIINVSKSNMDRSVDYPVMLLEGYPPVEFSSNLILARSS